MFSKRNINDIPTEETPHASGSRKMIVSKEEIPSVYFEAFTRGFLPPNVCWNLHKHNNIIEICLVIKGKGTIKDKNNNMEKFKHGDRFIFLPDMEHEIKNTSNEVAEFYFFRIKAK